MSTNYQELAKKLVLPAVMDYITVEVNVNLDSQLLRQFVTSLHSSLEVKVMMHGGQMPVTSEQLLSYCQSLVLARVDYVNSNRPTVTPRDQVVVPAFLSVVLQNLGTVTEHGIGYVFKPRAIRFEGDVEMHPVRSPLTQDEIFDISMKLWRLKDFGLEFAEELPRDRNGSFDFMTMQFIQNTLVTHNPGTAPVQALLAALLELRLVEAVFTPRVRYGDVTVFRRIIQQIATVGG